MASKVHDVEKQNFNGNLYSALMREDEEKVIELCRQVPADGGLHILTIHHDTVLHMATYSKQKNLVLRLLQDLSGEHHDKMFRTNNHQNTILHEAATNKQALQAADTMLRLAPDLLGKRNHRGETALYRAARYGQTEMFRFFAEKISEYDEVTRLNFLRRNDRTNILHISILAEHFDLALEIAKKYEHLIDEEDGDKMTGLQLLSCNSSAFKIGSEHGLLMGIIYSVAPCCSLSRQKAVDRQPEKQRYKSALELAMFLIEKDTSWEATYLGLEQSKPKLHKYGVNPEASLNEKKNGEGPSTASLRQEEGEGNKSHKTDKPSFSERGGEGPSNIGSLSQGERDGEGHQRIHITRTVNVGETPLFLATKSGCIEIVQEILTRYPQAVEYIDDEGRNILHVAIKYRQLHIFKLVRKMKVPLRRLVRKVDNHGNTILHTVGIIRRDYVAEKMQGPALQLQEELLWFERVKKVAISQFRNHLNNDKQTAEGLFAKTNVELRAKAKEWLKGTSEGCSLVAVLIATVAFAAAYTVPGGPDETTGFPVLLSKPFFVVFTVTDVISLTFALTAVVTFLSILSSSFRIEDFKQSLPNKLVLGFTFLFLSVSMMMVAFAATIILMIHNKERWTKIVLYATAFLPVGIFALSYFPLYLALSRTYKYLFKKAKRVSHWSKITDFFNCSKTQTHPPNSQNTSSSSSTCPATPQSASFPV